jgi:pilus assembly protein Flp/PilA
MMQLLKKLFRNKKGQGLVEYGLIIAGVALVCAAAVATFGHKTTDLWSAVTVIIPGAHTDDNNPIVSGKLLETSVNANGDIALDLDKVKGADNTDRLQQNLTGAGAGTNGFDGLIVEANP